MISLLLWIPIYIYIYIHISSSVPPRFLGGSEQEARKRGGREEARRRASNKYPIHLSDQNLPRIT